MKNSRGFTLVETIIALAVTSALVFIIINFMTNSIVQYAVVNARADLLNEAQSALDIMADDTRLSGNADANNRITDPNAPGAPDNEFSWASDNDTLVLATAVEDINGNIIFADPALYISEKNNYIYFVSDRKLYKRVLAAPVAENKQITSCPETAVTVACPADRVMLENVEAFNVRYYNDQNQEVTPPNARSIEVYVRLSRNQYQQQVSTEYTTRMVFRND
jgi:prepilin-type N-terminal cleavage/methylation domain-containing protein